MSSASRGAHFCSRSSQNQTRTPPQRRRFPADTAHTAVYRPRREKVPSCRFSELVQTGYAAKKCHSFFHIIHRDAHRLCRRRLPQVVTQRQHMEVSIPQRTRTLFHKRTLFPRCRLSEGWLYSSALHSKRAPKAFSFQYTPICHHFLCHGPSPFAVYFMVRSIKRE